MMRAPTISSDLKAADDLQEAISLIWMLDAGVRGLGLDLESPDGRACAGMANTFELVVEKLKGVGEQLEAYRAGRDK